MVDLLSGNVFSGTYSGGRLSYCVSGENILSRKLYSKYIFLKRHALVDKFVAFELVSLNLAAFCSCKFDLSLSLIELPFLEIIAYTIIFEKLASSGGSAVYFTVQVEYGLRIYIRNRLGKRQ